jgi:hypothetical protein
MASMSIDPDITTTAGEFDGPKIVDFFTHQRDDVPNVTLVDCGPRHVGTPPSKRPGQTWDAARAAHKYAMSAPDHELVMVVGKRASVTWQVNAVVEVAAEGGGSRREADRPYRQCVDVAERRTAAG